MKARHRLVTPHIISTFCIYALGIYNCTYWTWKVSIWFWVIQIKFFWRIVWYYPRKNGILGHIIKRSTGKFINLDQIFEIADFLLFPLCCYILQCTITRRNTFNNISTIFISKCFCEVIQSLIPWFLDKQVEKVRFSRCCKNFEGSCAM